MTTYRSAPMPRASRRGIDEKFTCRRCGSHNTTRVPAGCPWCHDCRGTIARDPDYLVTSYGVEEAQALLDQWINTRNGGPYKKRVLANAG